MPLRADPSVAVVGATGAVGHELLALLGSRRFPARTLRIFAGPRSAGRTAEVPGGTAVVEPLERGCFRGVDVAFFAATGAVSREWAPRAVAEGAWAIDKSSAFRMDPACALVIPEVNGSELDRVAGPAIVAVPNCTTIIALMAVTPIHRRAGVARMVVSTYQAVSGAGAAAMAELERQAHEWSAGRDIEPRVFGRQCLFNVFSHDSAVDGEGHNEEERKLLLETRRLWGDDGVGVAATCVRVPVLRAHTESIVLTLRTPLAVEEARRLLAESPGLRVVDDRAAGRFPEPLDAAGRDEVLVGRLRADPSQPDGLGLMLMVSGDQVRKGAALNGIQIAERLLSRAATR
jgi:aspartate-semialdehyde dehydrogenase